MMSFLRNMLKKDEERMIVSVDELDAWFGSQAIERLSGLDGALQGFYGQIKITIQQVRKYRDTLHHAVLAGAEPKVRISASRARDNYCRDLSIFLNSISIPEDTDVMQSYSLCHELMSSLDLFTEQTKATFSAVRQLYVPEAEQLGAALDEFRVILHGFSQFLQNKGVFVFSEIQANIIKLKKHKEKTERVLVDMNFKKTRLSQAQKQRALKEEEIAKLRGSEEFLSYQKLLDRLSSLEMQRAIADKEATELFKDSLHPIAPTLTADETLALATYTDNCAAALSRDSELVILDIITKLRSSGNSVNFREDKVHSLQSTLLALIADTAYVRRLMEQNPVASRLREEEYKLAHFVSQTDRFSKEISEMEGTLALGEIANLRSLIELKIREVLHAPLTISS